MDDATVAVEVAACEALVQWPYLSDLTLIWGLASVFVLPPAVGAGPACPEPPTALNALLCDPSLQCRQGDPS